MTVVVVVEADPEVGGAHLVGYSGLPNSQGVVQCDAAIMDGDALRFGAVAALEGLVGCYVYLEYFVYFAPYGSLVVPCLTVTICGPKSVTFSGRTQWISLHPTRDCNPGLEFSIPGFGIVEFPIPGSRRDWRSIVKTTKIATWVTVFGSLFLN